MTNVPREHISIPLSTPIKFCVNDIHVCILIMFNKHLKPLCIPGTDQYFFLYSDYISCRLTLLANWVSPATRNNRHLHEAIGRGCGFLQLLT
jgi:hypothetical protein